MEIKLAVDLANIMLRGNEEGCVMPMAAVVESIKNAQKIPVQNGQDMSAWVPQLLETFLEAWAKSSLEYCQVHIYILLVGEDSLPQSQSLDHKELIHPVQIVEALLEMTVITTAKQLMCYLFCR